MSVVNKFEKFQGLSAKLLSEVFSRLDRNFLKLEVNRGPFIVTTDFTFTADDSVDSIQADATTAAITVYLPSSPTGNRRRRVIKTDSSANTITVNGNGSLINGASTYILASQYDKCDVEPTGTGWLIVN